MTKLGKSAAAFAIILAGLGVTQGVFARGGGSGPSHDTSQSSTSQATNTGDEVSECARAGQGQTVIDCVAEAIATVSARVVRGEVAAKAPQLVTVTAQAAGIRGKPKAEALVVLTKLLAITRGLSTKSEADVRPAYNAIAGAFARAISVIERKG
jgi:hypothetical protein